MATYSTSTSGEGVVMKVNAVTCMDCVHAVTHLQIDNEMKENTCDSGREEYIPEYRYSSSKLRSCDHWVKKNVVPLTL